MRTSCGDWLLSIGSEISSSAADLPGRHSGGQWRPEERDGAAALWIHDAGAGWKGSPWTRLESPQWRVWLLGECRGEAAPLCLDVLAGDRDPTDLDGHFLLLASDRKTGRWHVLTDRFGTLHAYRAATHGRVAIGTFFPAVAAAASQRRLDWAGLTAFFACGFFLRDRTFFEDIKILRPATRYVLDRSGELVSGRRYWRWRHEPDQQRSYDDTVECFARRLEQVMAGWTRDGRVALPISGGLDSRATVAALPSATRERTIASFSYGYGERSEEVRIGRRIAMARGLPFLPLRIEPYLFDRLDPIVNSVEGFQDLTLCRQAAVVPELAAAADFVIAAHWGDVWLDDVGLAEIDRQPPRETFLPHVLGRVLKRGREWLLEHLCRPHLEGRDPIQLVREEVRTELDRVEHLEDPDFRVKAFKTDQWSFRWTTASLRAYQPAAFPRLPFYDSRLTDFFATVPSSFMKGRRLQIDYLKRHAPDLARITWDAYDADLYRARYYRSWLLPKRAVKKLWRVLTRRRPVTRNWEVQLGGEAGRHGLERWLLRDGLRLHDLVAPREIYDLLNRFNAAWPDPETGYAVSMLLTFSAWLERHG